MRTFLIVLLLSILTRADTRKIERVGLGDGTIAEASVILAPLKSQEISFSDVIIEKTSVSEIIDKYGYVETMKTGDASTSNSSVCYLSANGTAVRFNLGEMGGVKTVTKIDVFDKKSGSISNCIQSKRDAPVTNGSGIKLGLDRSEILKKFGKASHKTGKDIWFYMFSFKLKAPKCDGGWDVTGSYEFKFSKDKVISFSVARTTSC